MAVVNEVVPSELQTDVDAALAWFNATQQDAFEVTGIVDAEQSLASEYPRDLRLVLCGGDSCQKHNFQVSTGSEGLSVAFAADPFAPMDSGAVLQSELDPPPGALRNWLESVIPQHSFTLLLFYRGFW
ncbi:MAG: hypothetical protein AB8C02_17295 [Halioglobus sp.]